MTGQSGISLCLCAVTDARQSHRSANRNTARNFDAVAAALARCLRVPDRTDSGHARCRLSANSEVARRTSKLNWSNGRSYLCNGDAGDREQPTDNHFGVIRSKEHTLIREPEAQTVLFLATYDPKLIVVGCSRSPASPLQVRSTVRPIRT